AHNRPVVGSSPTGYINTKSTHQFNWLSAFLMLLKIKKLKYIPEFHTRKIKNAITYILFETTEVAKNVLMTWVWHPMGREGLEPATR
ncbi:hypothetical protein, partial [Enterococcus faecium]|uniref:hypothetical protein n=1 Tax=Enterococcus faecium TaxID=1352 RepID=UPI000AF8B9A2